MIGRLLLVIGSCFPAAGGQDLSPGPLWQLLEPVLSNINLTMVGRKVAYVLLVVKRRWWEEVSILCRLAIVDTFWCRISRTWIFHSVANGYT